MRHEFHDLARVRAVVGAEDREPVVFRVVLAEDREAGAQPTMSRGLSLHATACMSIGDMPARSVVLPRRPRTPGRTSFAAVLNGHRFPSHDVLIAFLVAMGVVEEAQAADGRAR